MPSAVRPIGTQGSRCPAVAFGVNLTCAAAGEATSGSTGTCLDIVVVPKTSTGLIQPDCAGQVHRAPRDDRRLFSRDHPICSPHREAALPIVKPAATPMAQCPARPDGNAAGIEHDCLHSIIASAAKQSSLPLRKDSGLLHGVSISEQRCTRMQLTWCEQEPRGLFVRARPQHTPGRHDRRGTRQARAAAEKTGRPARRFKDFQWSTLDTWSRRRRVVAKAEWTKGEANPRFVVTSLKRAEAGIAEHDPHFDPSRGRGKGRRRRATPSVVGSKEDAHCLLGDLGVLTRNRHIARLSSKF